MALLPSYAARSYGIEIFIREARSFVAATKNYATNPSNVFLRYERITMLFHNTLDRITRDFATLPSRKIQKQRMYSSGRVIRAYQRATIGISIYRKACSVPSRESGPFAKNPEQAVDRASVRNSFSGATPPTSQGEAGRAVRGVSSAETSTALFTDEEILQQHPISKMEPLVLKGQKFWVSFDDLGRSILTQIAINGCTAASAGMLILDWGKSPDLTEITTRQAASYETPADDISRAGLSPFLALCNNLTFETFRKFLILNGPAIVYLKKDLSYLVGHVVIVDAISEDFSQVRLRDPWYGWSITVKAEAFSRYWYNFHHDVPDHCLIQVLGHS